MTKMKFRPGRGTGRRRKKFGANVIEEDMCTREQRFTRKARL